MVNRTYGLIFLLPLLLSFLFLGACSYSTFFIPKQTKVYEPTEPESVIVSPQADLAIQYKRLASVSTMVWGDGDDAKASLQEEAALLGANAIIQFQVRNGFLRTTARGIAVRTFVSE